MIKDRYPDADVLAQRGHWDEATRKVIMDRVHNVPPFRYFDEHQRATLEALCARVIPQTHRPPEKRVPIAPWIDQRCYHHVISGFRFDNMPADEVAWELGLEGLDEASQSLFGGRFIDLDDEKQESVLRAVQEGNPPGEVWKALPVRRWWVYIALRQIVGTYYAHPYAWDEIGFGGPAYPRGYFALNHGAPEPWEADEVSDQGSGKGMH
ncbi:MAG: gluconate 2-dehydrogenase subunit 3 family protein [Chloroflexi bacterium]|nr:gluconate 2-dehydrogenase subunit 3 family protein [Chloroflexota bacterium]